MYLDFAKVFDNYFTNPNAWGPFCMPYVIQKFADDTKLCMAIKALKISRFYNNTRPYSTHRNANWYTCVSQLEISVIACTNTEEFVSKSQNLRKILAYTWIAG